MRKNEFFEILEGKIHIFTMFFDGQPCGFEISLGSLRGSWGRPGWTLGGPKSALGGLGGVPGDRAPHLEAPRGGLGTHFGDPRESAYSQNTHICEVF